MANVKKSNLKAKPEPEEDPNTDDGSIIVDNKPHGWDESFENICEILIDESQINTFLHQKSHIYYTKWSNRFQLPIIVLSALAGSANFISPKFGENKDLFLIMIGFVSILTSIISSVDQ